MCVCVCVTAPTVTWFVICGSPFILVIFLNCGSPKAATPTVFAINLFSGVCNTPLQALFYMLFFFMSRFYLFNFSIIFSISICSCVPFAMSFIVYIPVFISSSPITNTYGIFNLSAYLNFAFIFLLSK